MTQDPIEREILEEIAKLPAHEQLARAEYHWRLARTLFLTYSSTAMEVDSVIDLAEARRRRRKRDEEIYRAVEAELRAGAPHDLAFGRVAAARAGTPGEAHDAWSVGVLWRQERKRRGMHRQLIRNARIVAAVKLRGRTVRDVACSLRLERQTVARIVKECLAAARDDPWAAIEQLKQRAEAVRGPRPGRAPAPLKRSPLADVDPREGDGVIVEQIESWRRLAKDAARLGRRCRSRARIRAESILALQRALGITSRGATGILAKIEAAAELQPVRLLRGLARDAVRSARLDCERLAAEGGEITAVPDRSILLQYRRFQALWRDAGALGRRHRGRPLLKREAATALYDAVATPASTAAGLAAKLAAAEQMAGLRRLRQHVSGVLRLALDDARRLAALPQPRTVPTMPALAWPGGGTDVKILSALDRAMRILQPLPALLGDGGEVTDMAALRRQLSDAEDLLSEASRTPAVSPRGLMAKVHAAYACQRIIVGQERIEPLMLSAWADSVRLFGFDPAPTTP
jgi:hypothetical protein